MAKPQPPVTQAQFLTLFKSIALERHRHDVFRDFVTTSAIAIRNAVVIDESLEQEYLKIINTYDNEDIQKMCELLGMLIELLEPEPTDILGSLYMELGLSSAQNGQYFTPPYIAELMVQMTYGDKLQKLTKPFITLHEPACGSGGMVLAFAKNLISLQQNPAEKMWASCIDINRLAALICYLQLSLWNIPAEILVGNALTMEIKERWLTPAHMLHDWDFKLRLKNMADSLRSLMACDSDMKNEEKPPLETSDEPPLKESSDVQMGFDFRL